MMHNVWAVLKRKVAERAPATKQALIDAVENVWSTDADLRDMCRNAYDGMPQRVTALIHSRGGYTHY